VEAIDLSSRVPDAVRREVPLRGAGPILSNMQTGDVGPGSAAHHFVLRSVRGTRP